MAELAALGPLGPLGFFGRNLDFCVTLPNGVSRPDEHIDGPNADDEITDGWALRQLRKARSEPYAASSARQRPGGVGELRCRFAGVCRTSTSLQTQE